MLNARGKQKNDTEDQLKMEILEMSDGYAVFESLIKCLVLIHIWFQGL